MTVWSDNLVPLMSKQAIIGLISAIIVVLVGVLAFVSDREDATPTDTPATTTNQDVSGEFVRTIDALHQFQPEEGRHIVAGTTTVPTPCHQLSTDTTVRESDPQQVTVDFSATKRDADAVCAQQIQEVRFKTSFMAGENVEIVGGTYNGDQVELNLRQVDPGEDLDSFNIYTKG